MIATAVRCVHLSVVTFILLWPLSFAFSQPYSDQDWNRNVSISGGAITVQCAEFVLPVDVGRELIEFDPLVEGEMSRSMRAAHENKITLLPESGSTDTLTTINGCPEDGAKLFLSTEVVGHTITLANGGNFDLASSIALDHPRVIVEFVNEGGLFKAVGAVAVGGGGGGGSKIITDASESAPHIIANNPSFDENLHTHWRTFVDSGSNIPVHEGRCDGAACPINLRIQPGQALNVFGDSGLLESIAADGTRTYDNEGKLSVTETYVADSMVGDGSNCDATPTDETIGGEPDRGIRCPMTVSESDGFIRSLFGVKLHPGFDKTEGIQFEIRGFPISPESPITAFGRITVSCTGDGANRGSFGDEVALNLNNEGGDESHDPAPAVLPVDGSAGFPDCDPNDTIRWRFRMCDTDVSPSPGCTSNAGNEDNFSIFLVSYTYKVNALP